MTNNAHNAAHELVTVPCGGSSTPSGRGVKLAVGGSAPVPGSLVAPHYPLRGLIGVPGTRVLGNDDSNGLAGVKVHAGSPLAPDRYGNSASPSVRKLGLAAATAAVKPSSLRRDLIQPPKRLLVQHRPHDPTTDCLCMCDIPFKLKNGVVVTKESRSSWDGLPASVKLVAKYYLAHEGVLLLPADKLDVTSVIAPWDNVPTLVPLAQALVDLLSVQLDWKEVKRIIKNVAKDKKRHDEFVEGLQRAVAMERNRRSCKTGRLMASSSGKA